MKWYDVYNGVGSVQNAENIFVLHLWYTVLVVTCFVPFKDKSLILEMETCWSDHEKLNWLDMVSFKELVIMHYLWVLKNKQTGTPNKKTDAAC